MNYFSRRIVHVNTMQATPKTYLYSESDKLNPNFTFTGLILRSFHNRNSRCIYLLEWHLNKAGYFFLSSTASFFFLPFLFQSHTLCLYTRCLAKAFSVYGPSTYSMWIPGSLNHLECAKIYLPAFLLTKNPTCDPDTYKLCLKVDWLVIWITLLIMI